MPTITDWLMVFVTIVYVIATIFICIANIRSAKASQAQLSEMRHEYEENQRIGVMPYLNIYKCREAVSIQGETSCWLTEPDTKNILKTTVVFQIINHGPGIAVDVILMSDKFCQDATTGCGGKNLAKTSVSGD